MRHLYFSTSDWTKILIGTQRSLQRNQKEKCATRSDTILILNFSKFFLKLYISYTFYIVLMFNTSIVSVSLVTVAETSMMSSFSSTGDLTVVKLFVQVNSSMRPTMVLAHNAWAWRYILYQIIFSCSHTKSLIEQSKDSLMVNCRL